MPVPLWTRQPTPPPSGHPALFLLPEIQRCPVLPRDNPETVSEVARRAGIEGAERFVDAETLQSEEALAAAASQ